MNYCIVMPKLTQINDQSYQFPIGMAYVSASLKASGRNVKAYNLNYKIGDITDLVGNLIRDYDIDVLATGGLTAHYHRLREILEAAREAKPDIILAVGGVSSHLLRFLLWRH